MGKDVLGSRTEGIAHRGKWMGEGGVSGLASVEFEILVSIFFTSTSTRGVAASVENKDFRDFPRDGCDSSAVYCATAPGGAWRGLV